MYLHRRLFKNPGTNQIMIMNRRLLKIHEWIRSDEVIIF